jgi:hypothetical protein
MGGDKLSVIIVATGPEKDDDDDDVDVVVIVDDDDDDDDDVEDDACPGWLLESEAEAAKAFLISNKGGLLQPLLPTPLCRLSICLLPLPYSFDDAALLFEFVTPPTGPSPSAISSASLASLSIWLCRSRR